ncbi:MAG: UDP-N-acetylmuramoylalanine--D-glutamate ligase [Candidatus Melainabacteria bacterium GWF2_32_7]|nr:MAG: UDP-N-acetylmuramoylalanine--D-glutamate ligase [Candidatus Melainabacteria bacterium GWF2_32_7]
MTSKWIDKNVTVLGFSLSGIATAKYLSKKGANCIISEKRNENPEDQEKIKELKSLGIDIEMGGHREETILNSDLVVTSPGIPPHSEVIKLIKAHKIQTTGEIGLAYTETPVPFIAITGTNGKTTTTKLVSEILTNAGYNAPACGNIGLPVINLVEKSNIDYFVTEVSSYQIDTNPVFKPQIALFINYTPDHVDWHGSKEAYFEAKAALFTEHRSPIWTILNACDPKVYELRHKSLSQIIYFGREMPGSSVYIKDNKIFAKGKNRIKEIIEIKDIPLIGKHNYQNIMAAIAIASVVGVEPDIIRETIKNFKPPEHRLEYVATIDGISYYNDSKATNCDSTICALKAFEDKKVVLIAGGRDKGTDLAELVQVIKEQATHVVLIGEAADRFQKALQDAGYTNITRASLLEESIDIAASLKLGPVLFAPACASFDMFKNFEERGRAFKDYVIKKSN